MALGEISLYSSVGTFALEPSLINGLGVATGSAGKFLITPKFGSQIGEAYDVLNSATGALLYSSDALDR